MSEWKTYKLRDVVNILDYKRIPLSSRQREQRRGKYPYYGAQGIIDYIDDYIFDGTYLLVAEDGENLRSKKQHIAQLVSGKYWVNNHAHILESNGLCDIRYICYLLNVFDISGYITGSAQPKLNQANLLAIEISLPPLAEQKRIADILSAIDDKIELNRRINANLEQQAQALYKSWFGGISSNITLQEITLNITDGVHNTVKDDCSGEYLLLSCKNIVGGHLVIGPNERRINKETFDKLRKRTRLSEGDILVSTVGTVGEIVILLDPPANVEFQRSVGIIKPNISKASPYYIYCALKDKQEALKHTAHGAVQQCIFIGDLKNFEIPYSYSKKLIEFDTIVSPMFNQLTINHRESNYLTQLRDTLLPKLMSGEIAV